MLPSEAYGILAHAWSRATTTGEPIKFWARAVATLEAPGEWFDDAREDPLQPRVVGHFQSPTGATQSGGCIGRIVLAVEPPVFVSLLRYHRVLATQRVDVLGRDVEFVVDPRSPLLDKATLLGRAVSAASREPLAAVHVMLDGLGSRFSDVDPSKPGAFSFTDAWPGWYCVWISARGFASSRISVLLEPGQTLDLGDIELQPETWVNALVIDERGNGVSAQFAIDPFGSESSTVWRSPTVEVRNTNGDGTLHIGGLLPGKYLLSLGPNPSLPWARMVKLVDTSNGPVENLRIDVSPGVALVIRAANEGAVGMRWTLRNSDGLRVMSTRLSGVTPVSLKFAPGKYTVEVDMPNGAAPLVHDIVLADEPVELALP